MADSTRTKSGAKGTARRIAAGYKPYQGFPLTAHKGTNRWCKKCRGKQYYFGPLDDWEAALELYKHQWPYILKGQTPPPMDGDESQVFTLKDLGNYFMTAKKKAVESGELSQRSADDYENTLRRFLDFHGKHRAASDLSPIDFAAWRADRAKTCGAYALRGEVVRIRTAFKWAFESGYLDRPAKFGPDFKPPTAKNLRTARNAHGPRIFGREALQAILSKAPLPMRAMAYLAINCAYGATDVSTLPLRAIDLETGWADYPRPKTAVDRRAWLWPETIEVLRQWLEVRPEPANDETAKLLFLMDDGTPHATPKGVSLVSDQFARLLKSLEVHRKQIGFYALRRHFETIASETLDQPAIDRVMGHVDSSMAAVYREQLGDDRIRRVCEHVRSWALEGMEGGRQ